MGVRLKDVPAAAGGLWIRQAFATFRRRPGLYLSAFAGLSMVLMLFTLMGLFGLIAFGLVVPLGSLLFMMITAWSLADLPGHGRLAATPFASTIVRRRGLVGLCALYCTGMLVVSVLASWTAGDSMQAYLEDMRRYYENAKSTAEMPEPSGQLVGALGVLYGGLSLLAISMWHAMALVHWGGQGAAQALFSSALALWRTRRAFVVYLVGWITLGFAVMFVANVLALVGLGVFVLPLFLTAMMALATVFYVSFYFTFTGTFEIDD